MLLGCPLLWSFLISAAMVLTTCMDVLWMVLGLLVWVCRLLRGMGLFTMTVRAPCGYRCGGARWCLGTNLRVF